MLHSLHILYFFCVWQFSIIKSCNIDIAFFLFFLYLKQAIICKYILWPWSESCIICHVSLKLCYSVVLYCIFKHLPSSLILSLCLMLFLPPRFAITASNLLAGPLLPPPQVCYGPSTNPPSGNLPLLNAPPASSIASSSSKQLAGTCWQRAAYKASAVP